MILHSLSTRYKPCSIYRFCPVHRVNATAVQTSTSISFKSSKHPIAHYILMIRPFDNKSHFEQVLDEATIHRNTVRRLWLGMCSSMQRVMNVIVYDTVPLFDCNEIVERDEAYVHWKAGLLAIQWRNEVVVEEKGG